MNLEHFLVYFAEACMVMLGSVLLWAHTKNKIWIVSLIMFSGITVTCGWLLELPVQNTIPLVMIYAIMAIGYALSRMDRRIDTALGKPIRPAHSYRRFDENPADTSGQ